eukprot:4046319-Prymnesium_polylepis.1
MAWGMREMRRCTGLVRGEGWGMCCSEARGIGACACACCLLVLIRARDALGGVTLCAKSAISHVLARWSGDGSCGRRCVCARADAVRRVSVPSARQIAVDPTCLCTYS